MGDPPLIGSNSYRRGGKAPGQFRVILAGVSWELSLRPALGSLVIALPQLEGAATEMSVSALEQDKDFIRERLLAGGVPPPVVEYALTLPFDRWSYRLLFAVLFVIMFGGLGVIAAAWWQLAVLTNENAREHAAAVGGLLWYAEFGVSMFPAPFAFIFSAGWAAALMCLISPRLMTSSFVFSVVDSFKARHGASVRNATVTRLASETDPARYIRRYTTSWIPWFAWPALVFVVLTLALLPRDVQAHSIFTPNGYLRSAFLPWASRDLPWTDAVEVQLGCNHVTGKNAGDFVVYTVKFENGASVSLGGARPMTGSWLDQAEIIDVALVQAGAEFQRWEWLQRDPLDPACLLAKRRANTAEDYQRLLRLLRVDP